MELTQKQTYKYCFVPSCKNTVRRTPDKVFLCVPKDSKIRKKWCEVIKRDEVSPTACLYCCEDHFNIEEDTINYTQYNIMKKEGVKVTLRLKKGVLPHKCLFNNRNIPQIIATKELVSQEKTLSKPGYVCVECSDCKVSTNFDYIGDHDNHYLLRVPKDRPQIQIDKVLAAIRSACPELSNESKTKSKKPSKTHQRSLLRKHHKNLPNLNNHEELNEDAAINFVSVQYDCDLVKNEREDLIDFKNEEEENEVPQMSD